MNRENFTLFARLFSGRQGVLKQRSSKKDIFENLTEQHLLDQLAIKDSYGIYLRTEKDTVKVAMFDLDVANSKLPLSDLLFEIEQIRPQVEAVMGAAEELGLSKNSYLIEFPGVGYHIWFFFEDEIPASLAATFLEKVENAARIGPVVLKPRQVQISKGSFGEAVWFPLRLNDNSNLHSVFIENWNEFNPASYDPTPNFQPLRTVKPIPTALVNKIINLG